jgi:hypothetical protein
MIVKNVVGGLSKDGEIGKNGDDGRTEDELAMHFAKSTISVSFS